MAEERRDALPSAEDIALGLTYESGIQVNPLTVALHLSRANDLREKALLALDSLWDLVDTARNRP